jgi:hypothetical protein
VSVFSTRRLLPRLFLFGIEKQNNPKVWRSSPLSCWLQERRSLSFSPTSLRASFKKRGKKKKESNRRFCFSIVPGQDTRFLVYRRELPLTFLALDPPDGQKNKKKESKNSLAYAAEHCRPVTCLDFPPNPEKMFPTRKKKKRNGHNFPCASIKLGAPNKF